MKRLATYMMTAAMTLCGTAVTAQTMNSAYFTGDYKYRHDLNPAYGNEQNYISWPALGNLNVSTHGNFGYGDVVMNNPCLLYTSPSPRDSRSSGMPSSA